jgi:lactate dehydrogenase-like 2-hydroxyacid dehydrogenase
MAEAGTASDAARDVLCLHPLRPAHQAELEAAHRVHRLDRAANPEALLAEVGPRVEAVVTSGHVPLGPDLLDRLPRLAIVACGSAGTEAIDDAALRERGIPLTTVSEALADEVADLALLLLLAAWRRLLPMDRHVREGAWARGEFPLGHALAGRRLGLAGIGSIGQAVARRAVALRLEVAYFARRPRPSLPWRFEPDLRRLAEASDILVLSLPGGDATRGLASAEVIEALGRGGVAGGCLVNVGRGSVVDEPALVAALRDGRLGSAGLDVFAREPDPDPALLGLPNVVLTPHAGSATEDTRDAMSRHVLDSLAAHFAAHLAEAPPPA